VRLHFRDRPWDVYLAIAYTMGASIVLLVLGTGHPLAILLVLPLPGYVLTAALFPRAQDIDWIERIALSFGLSIAVVPLLGLLLNFTPFGIRFGPIVATLALFTLLVGLGAYWRRMRLPSEQRLSFTLDLNPPAWNEYGFVDKVLTIALAASIVVAGATLMYVLATPRPGERFTEFYILGPGGNASGYPTALNVSEPGTVFVGVVNHESASVNYTVRVSLVGVNRTFNATLGYNVTVEVNRTVLDTWATDLGDAANETWTYTFTIDAAGTWKVEFLLFRDGDFTAAYRSLHLFVTVPRP